MKAKFAHFNVEERYLDGALHIIRIFVCRVRENEPGTLYFSFRNGNAFTHVMRFPDKQAENKHKNASYTVEFVKHLYPLCVKAPVFTDVVEVEP